MSGVRIIREDERAAWCACPFETTRYIQEEEDWLAHWHGDCRNLFAYETGGRFLGKYDVPIERPGRWELWAPSVRPGPDAAEVMDALCRHILTEARRRNVASVEVILEESHRSHDLARTSLLAAGFNLAEERVVFRRDLRVPLPEAGGPSLHLVPEEDGLVALLDDAQVGLVRRGSRPGEEPFRLEHLGLNPEARGRGLGLPLLLAVLALARREGAKTYVGSTGTANAAMLRVFERAGCTPIGKRLIFRS